MAEHNAKIRFWLTPLPDPEADPFFGPQMAYDLEVLQPEATVGDYLAGLEDFQARTLADCKGCDGCCHERAPLTIADWQLSSHSGPLAEGLADWLLEWAELGFWGPAIDLTLRRAENGSCQFLDEKQKCCKIHPQRGFTCRSHCCLPKTERAEALRAAIINAGEDELVRQLLSLPQPPWADRLAKCSLADYAANAFSHLPAADWAQAKLQDLAGPELWAKIFQPDKNL